MIHGRVLAVSTDIIGDSLTTATVGGATTILELEDASPFDETGGFAAIIDDEGTIIETFTYTTADWDDDTLTLSAPIAGSYDVGTIVAVIAADVVTEPLTEVIAEVQPDDDELPAIRARVPYSTRAQLPEGPRADVAGEGDTEPVRPPEEVIVDLVRGRWVVTDIVGAPPVIDARNLDLTGTTIIESDGAAPSASPTPEVIGGVGYLAVRWTAVTNPDPVTYQVHVSESSGFTPDSSTLAGEITGTLFFIRKLPNGDPLEYDTTYYVKLIAYDIDGFASASTESSGQLVRANSPDIAAEAITADHILAGAVTVDKLAAVLILSNALKTAESGRRVEIDEAGVRLIGQDETVLVNIPTDADTPAYFSGELLASTLTATGGIELRSTDNIMTKDAALTLQAGQGPPTSGPTLTQNVESVPFNSNSPEAANKRRALWHDGSSFIYLTGDATQDQVLVKVDFNGNEVSRTTMQRGNTDLVHLWCVVKVSGSTKDWWFGLGYNSSFWWSWYIWADDQGMPTGNPTRRNWTEWTGWHAPMLTTDGTDLFICQSDQSLFGGTTKAQILRYTPTFNDPNPPPAPTYIDTRLTDVQGPGTEDIAGYVRSAADFGSARNVIMTLAATNILVFNTANPSVKQANDTFAVAEQPLTPVGLTWDGTNFWQLSANSKVAYKYTGFRASGGTSQKFYAAFTWFDSNATGGTHETALSPRSTITWKNRRRLSVSWPPIPGAGGVDDPNSVRLYLKASTTDPGPDFSSYYRQGAARTGTQAYLTSYSTSTAGSQATPFPGEVGGTIKSSNFALGTKGSSPLMGWRLTADGSNDGIHPEIQIFNTPGTYTWYKPVGSHTLARIICIGGGGGGGSGRRGATGTDRLGGGGGAGGVRAEAIIPLSALNATETVIVGAGGTGGAAVAVNDTNGQDGADGGTSSFGAWVVASGGGGGKGGRAGAGGEGGVSASTSVDTAHSYAGGNGGASSSGTGGGANGSATTAANANGGGGGGGGGGGVDASNNHRNGGNGGRAFNLAGGSGGSTSGTANGGDGAATPHVDYAVPGGGGGGGAGAQAQPAGNGGNGAKYGGGGGGGGARNNGGPSGAGGNGAGGIVVVFTF